MSKRFKVMANIPVLGANAHQTIIVEGSNWMVALGKAARQLKRLPVFRRRRVTAISMVLQQMEGDGNVDRESSEMVTVDSQQSLGLEGNEAAETGTETNEAIIGTESIEPILEIEDVLTDAEVAANNKEADDEAELLIEEGPAETEDN